jgi:hypothetical protein
LVNLCLGLARNNALSVPVSRAVLPGPEQAGAPFQQKYTAISTKIHRHFNKNTPFGKNTPLIHIFKKIRYFYAN